jgi:iron-sulfur cluster repair protein YtfE (RIC family)
MRITDLLLGEHGVLYAQFDRLEMVLPAIAGAREIRELVALLVAGLSSHAQAEDELLFGTAIVDGVAPDVLRQMAEEHRAIEELLERAQRARTADGAREALLEAIALARAHFRREEQLVFPELEERLAPSVLSGLAVRWAMRRGVMLQELGMEFDVR